jgi:hypothetical protein
MKDEATAKKTRPQYSPRALHELKPTIDVATCSGGTSACPKGARMTNDGTIPTDAARGASAVPLPNGSGSSPFYGSLGARARAHDDFGRLRRR